MLGGDNDDEDYGDEIVSVRQIANKKLIDLSQQQALTGKNLLKNPDNFNENAQSKKTLQQQHVYFSDLELNTDFDENITFNHFYSVYKEFDSLEDNDTTSYYPFLTKLEYSYSLFDEKRPIKEANQESKPSMLARIKQFSTSKDEKIKKQFLDNMKIYSESLGISTVNELLIPTLSKIIDDTLSIKIKFLTALLDYIDYLIENGDIGYEILKNNILKIIDELYHPGCINAVNVPSVIIPGTVGYEFLDNEMKYLLLENFVKIAKNLKTEDKQSIVVNFILGFYTNDFRGELKTEMNMICIKLISRLAQDLGKETTENFLLPTLYSLSDDQNSKMRIEVLKTIANIIDVFSVDKIKNCVYEIIKKLSNDKIWEVKKTCVDIMPKIIKINKEKCIYEQCESNNKLFVGIVEKFTIDNQYYVRLTVLEKIGEIIANLDKEELSIKLYEFYKSKMEEYYFNNTINNNNNMNMAMSSQNKKKIYYFAYNFPAILYCYGPEYWEPLKKNYINLCNENDENVRRSIISSFHELCAILGQEKTEKELLKIYDNFLENKNGNVKEKNLAVRHLPKILKNVQKSVKEKYFKYFEAVSLFLNKENEEKIRSFHFINWKNKLDVAEGILCYYNLYDNDVIYNSIIPQCIKFCFDEICKVRYVSAKVLAELIVYLYEGGYKKDSLTKLIECFAYNKYYKNRITFVKMCKIFLNNYNIYGVIIKNIIKKLCFDHNLNVRISLAKLLSKIIVNDKCPCYNDKDIHYVCKVLVKYKIKCIDDMFYDLDINCEENISDEQINNLSTFKEDFNFLVEEFTFHQDDILTNNKSLKNNTS